LRAQKAVRLVKSVTQYVVEYLAPPSCLGCKKPASWLCRTCNLSLGPPPELVCPSCLSQNADGTRCKKCVQLEVPLQQLVSAYAYEERVFHRLLAAYKERGLRDVHTMLGTRLVAQLKPLLIGTPIVTAIPCSRRRRRERGFDQAELLAKFVAKKLSLEYAPDILRRSKEAGTQKELGQLARRTHLKDLYAINVDSKALAPCRKHGVLLIDDVATSLATLETCATLLKRAGIGDVRAGVLAHAAIG